MALSSTTGILGQLRKFTLAIILIVTINIFALMFTHVFVRNSVAVDSESSALTQSDDKSAESVLLMRSLYEPQVDIKELDVYKPQKSVESKLRRVRINNISTRKNMTNLKKILVWNDYWKSQALWHKIFHDIIYNKCPHSSCILTSEKSELESSDAVLFHLLDLHRDKYRVPQYRDPKQIWIAMSFEPPYIMNYAGLDFPRLNGVFNRTMTYRQDSDIVVRHGTFWPIEDSNKVPHYMSRWVGSHDNIKERNYAEGKRRLVAWFASSRGCRSQSNRETYVQQLQQYIPVDIYGACGPYKCGIQKTIRNPYKVEHDDCYLLVSVAYKFVLAFENSVCEDYVTEKLYNHLKLNVVPVVFGGSNYSYYAPPYSIIDATQFTPKELADYLLLLDGNDHLYNEYFRWKKDYYIEAHDGIPLICDLCDKLNRPEWVEEKKVYDHVDQWFQNSCFPPYNGNESVSYADSLSQVRYRGFIVMAGFAVTNGKLYFLQLPRTKV